MEEEEEWDIWKASKKGRLGWVQERIAVGQDVNERNAQEETPLHFACCGGREEVVDCLISAGADVNARDKRMRTPLFDASGSVSNGGGVLECMKRLLAAGADASLPDSNGTLPIHNVCDKPWYSDFVRLLCEAYPAGVCKQGEFYRLPLHYAALCGALDSMRLLLNAAPADLKIDTMDHNGETPLHMAIEFNRRECAAMLINAGAQLEAVQRDKGVPRIPMWASALASRREACRAASIAVVGLLHHSRLIGGNGKDVLRLIGRMVWQSRFLEGEKWGHAAKRCVVQ